MIQDEEMWVFLSHSNKDFSKVRILRNLLEEESYRPLMFFLQCLNDEDEIDELIKREIDCRKRFILCDSENARKSDWVKKEVEYIKSSLRFYQSVDIEAPVEEIKEQVRKFRRNSTIFIFHSEADEALAIKVQEALRDEMEFFVHSYKEIPCYPDIHNAVDYAMENGFVLFLLTENFPSYKITAADLDYAMSKDNKQSIKNFESCEQRIIRMMTSSYKGKITYSEINLEEKEGRVFFNKGRLYCNFMLDRIKLGVEQNSPASQYWMAYYIFHYVDSYEFDPSDHLRRYTLHLAKKSADAGFGPGQELYQEIYEDLKHNYPSALDEPYR